MAALRGLRVEAERATMDLMSRRDYAEERSSSDEHEVASQQPVVTPETMRLASQIGNRAMGRLADGAAAPRGLLSRELLTAQAVSIQRDGPTVTAPPVHAPQPGATTGQTYEVGGVVYNDSQWNVAVSEVAHLWNTVGGVISKRKEAVAEFCGSGGAGAAASPSITDALLTAAITAAIAAATDGVGLVVAGALSRGVTAIARRVSIDPAIVLERGNQVVTAAVNAGKAQANQRIGAAVQSHPSPAPSGGTELATPLAHYMSALNETLDQDGVGSHRATLQQLLNQGGDPPGAKWAVAAALHDALSSTVEQAKRQQWNATSDGWFRMQIESGAGQSRGYDTGIVVIDLKKDAYPTDRLRADGGYLGGEGANDATMRMYNDRKLEEIALPMRIRMDNGSMGHGLVECGWQAYVPIGATAPTGVRHITRWGLPWLAAKALGLRDIPTDDERVNGANVARGTALAWDELKGQTIAQLGGRFSVMSMTSGVGASPFV
jgi:hypothetical protein